MAGLWDSKFHLAKLWGESDQYDYLSYGTNNPFHANYNRRKGQAVRACPLALLRELVG